MRGKAHGIQGFQAVLNPKTVRVDYTYIYIHKIYATIIYNNNDDNNNK